jgi:regulator of sigma E protease
LLGPALNSWFFWNFMFLTLLAFIVALGVLVTFHELGHYWVARLCGVKILRFSVGFGKVLVQRVDKHGTEWALAAIPLGGYVKMLDDPESLPVTQSETSASRAAASATMAFNQKPLIQRTAIVLAGPVANLLLAAVLYTSLNLAGTLEPEPYLAQPPASSVAAQAGIQAGDKILAVNDKSIRSWSEARWQLLDVLSSGGNATLHVQTADGVRTSRVMDLQGSTIEPDGVDMMVHAGLALAMPSPRVAQVISGSAGEQADLREGDVIIAVGSLQDPSTTAFIQEVQRHPDQSLTVTVLRDAAPVAINVVPRAETIDAGAQVGKIGVVLNSSPPMTTVSYGLIDSVQRGVERTGQTVWFSLKMMGRMVTGDVSLRNVSGPVTIADYAGQTARIGLAAYIGFLALISVSIGVLNLLPIPMLDGGHLMYYALEAVRGKPVPDRWQETGQRIGLGLLAALMSLAFFNDFSRLFS